MFAILEQQADGRRNWVARSSLGGKSYATWFQEFDPPHYLVVAIGRSLEATGRQCRTARFNRKSSLDPYQQPTRVRIAGGDLTTDPACPATVGGMNDRELRAVLAVLKVIIVVLAVALAASLVVQLLL